MVEGMPRRQRRLCRPGERAAVEGAPDEPRALKLYRESCAKGREVACARAEWLEKKTSSALSP